MFIVYYYVKVEGNCDFLWMSDFYGEFGGKNVFIKWFNVDIVIKFGKMFEDVFQYLGQCRVKFYVYRFQWFYFYFDDKVIFFIFMLLFFK